MARVGFWGNKRVLVTGANGFIGSWVAKALVDQGASVMAIVRDMDPRGGITLQGLHNDVTIVAGDITDYFLVERVLNEYEVDTCFHLAAQTIVQKARRSPMSTFRSNIEGTWNILEACRVTQSVERIVVASSDKAYGDQPALPYTEDLPLLGTYPYDASKACTEIIARSYFATYGLPVATTRCANIYGGGDLNFSRIIPDSLRSILRGEPPVIRSDGTPVRDYLYVKDAAGGYLSLAEHMDDPSVKGEAFNLGCERPLSVLDLVKIIVAASGRKDLAPQVLGKGKPAAEIERQWLSAAKARDRLGWSPRYTLEQGLAETVQWYEEYFARGR